MNSPEEYFQSLVELAYSDHKKLAKAKQDAEDSRYEAAVSLRFMLEKLDTWEEVDHILDELYWTSPIMDKLIHDIWKCPYNDFDWKEQHIYKPKPKTIEIYCCICNMNVPTLCASWITHHTVTLRQQCRDCWGEYRRQQYQEQKSLQEEKDRIIQEQRRTEQAKKEPDKPEIKEIPLNQLPYSEYLQTEHWKKLRLEPLRRSGFRCSLCYTNAKLHVHHRTYERLGREYLSDLIALCEDCHSKFHDKLPKGGNLS